MSTKTFLNSIGYAKKWTGVLLCLAFLTLTASCGPLLGYGLYQLIDGAGGGGGGGGEVYSPTEPIIEATKTYAIALGGVAPGRDELVVTDLNGNLVNLAGRDLRFEADTDIIGFLPRAKYEDFAEGSGAKIIPQKVGTATVTYYIDNVLQEDNLLVIVPPQSLIQMMIAEAGEQLTGEAEVDEIWHVKLDSVSPTANAIGAVTRNRVNLIDSGSDYSIFNVNEYEWSLNPPGSNYDAVITASDSGIYQYSPVDPDDPTHRTYTNAEARGFLDPSLHRAYDQAVLSAAHTFSGETADPTSGAFAFFSPTAEEWEEIQQGYNNNMVTLPTDCGVSDSDFPNFSPIQILVLPGVWTYSDGRPSFVFIRSRDPLDYAVVKTP